MSSSLSKVVIIYVLACMPFDGCLMPHGGGVNSSNLCRFSLRETETLENITNGKMKHARRAV